VVAHAAGLALLLMTLERVRVPTSFWPILRLVVLMTWWLVFFHAAEIAIWAWFYLGSGSLPDAETAFYFSAVTYTSIGYGDLVLAKPWRLLAPIEGLTGILMCGLSAAVYFAIVSRMYEGRSSPRS
jgi:hypothetical protein